MDESKKYVLNKYDRVMPRVYNRSRSSLKSTSFVTRHQTPSSAGVGGKPSVSNVSSAVFSDLPIVLNDYKMDVFPEKPPRRPFVVKPRRTLKSLDPALSPPRSVRRSLELRPRTRGVRARGSAPSVLAHGDDKWPESHMRQCLSSRSHTKLKELKEEIKAYQDTEKLMRLRSQLYKRCGVVLDDMGQVAEDKAVQVELATGAEVKSAWLKLRNCHRDALRRKERTATTKPWKYEREMEFLMQYMAMANRTTDNAQDPLSDENSYEIKPMRASFNKKRKKNKTENIELQAQIPIKHEEIAKEKADEGPNASTADNDELYHFYMSMYSITKQLPLTQQILIKRKIFNLVTEEQEQMLCRRATTSLSSEHYFEIKCEEDV